MACASRSFRFRSHDATIWVFLVVAMLMERAANHKGKNECLGRGRDTIFLTSTVFEFLNSSRLEMEE
jgi:hypothetical protein